MSQELKNSIGPVGPVGPVRRVGLTQANEPAEALINARAGLRPTGDEDWSPKPAEAEGGCGVTGFACTIPVGGKHIYEPSKQMRNLLILKIVGYAEGAAQYYHLNDLRAHVWIARQRYPMRGRVWHPGGCHPFIGMNEALVHNGDFLAESFMEGNPHTGGGFAIISGLRMDESDRIGPLDRPYPGSNLLSLASGGAIYVRDSHRTLVAEQLNGGASG